VQLVLAGTTSGMISGGNASRAAIKKALLAIQLTRKQEEQNSEFRENERLSGPALPAVRTTRRILRPDHSGEAERVNTNASDSSGHNVFKGGTVNAQQRKRELLRRGASRGFSRSEHSLDGNNSDSSGSDTPDAKTETKATSGGEGTVQLGLDLEMQRPQVSTPTLPISPFGSGLAAMKVKHRLQALHQEAKKKPSQQSSTSTSTELSLRNLAAEKAQQSEKEAAAAAAAAQSEKEAQQANAMAALINAARTTLPNFSSPPDEAEEAEIMGMLAEADSELLDLVKEVQRILRWLFADADSDFDSQLSHQELKAIFQRAPQPLGSSLGMEVDISTQQGEKNLPLSRSRFIELVILVCVRVNQSPILTSRLADVKRFVGRGNSAAGRSLDNKAGSTERLPEMKVSLLSGVPRMESSPAKSKWLSAKSAVQDVVVERRKSQSEGEMSPLKKLESLFASVHKS